jgi:hypothetical protein
MSDVRKEYDEFFEDAIGRNPEPISVIGYDAWLASQLLARREEVARLREAIASVIDERHITGAEEFVVLSLTIEEYRNFAALSASPAPAKTCRWTRVASGGPALVKYKGDCGQEWEYKWGYGAIPATCPCGLPIEEVKEETT